MATVYYSARRISVNALEKLVTQNAHGFIVGQLVVFNGTAYVLAKADTLAHCQGVLMVSVIVDVNNFYVVQEGYVTQLPLPRTPGVQFYVDPVNAGALTSIMPATIGQVNLPCFVSTNSYEGYFYTGSGVVVVSGSGFTWQVVGVNQTMVASNGYLTSSGGTVNLQFPALASIGDVFRISNLSGNFKIVQQAGQSVNFGDDTTTVGVTGYIQSASVGDTLEIVCYNANAGFQVLNAMGNLSWV